MLQFVLIMLFAKVYYLGFATYNVELTISRMLYNVVFFDFRSFTDHFWSFPEHFRSFTGHFLSFFDHIQLFSNHFTAVIYCPFSSIYRFPVIFRSITVISRLNTVISRSFSVVFRLFPVNFRLFPLISDRFPTISGRLLFLICIYYLWCAFPFTICVMLLLGFICIYYYFVLHNNIRESTIFGMNLLFNAAAIIKLTYVI